MRNRLPVSPISRTLLVLAAGLAVVGCDEPFGLGRAWIDGEWIYAAETLSNRESDCEIGGLTLVFDQEGGSFSGVVEGGRLTCTTGAESLTRSLAGAPITSGEVSGRDVAFEIGAGLLAHEGRVDGRSLTGTVIVSIEVGGRTVTLEGPFAAARSPRSSAD